MFLFLKFPSHILLKAAKHANNLWDWGKKRTKKRLSRTSNTPRRQSSYSPPVLSNQRLLGQARFADTVSKRLLLDLLLRTQIL